MHNPSLIAASVVGAVIAKLASMQLTDVALKTELEQWANYFFKVTNNLQNYYKYASDQATEYF